MPADGYHTQEESDLLFVSGKTVAKRKGGERSFSDAINTIKGMSSNQGERGVGVHNQIRFFSLSLSTCACVMRRRLTVLEKEKEMIAKVKDIKSLLFSCLSVPSALRLKS